MAIFCFRSWQPSDVAAYRKIFDDPSVWQYMDGYPGPFDDALALELILLAADSDAHEVRAVEFDGQVIGQVRLLFEADNPSVAEIAYVLGTAHHGRGLAARMVPAYLASCAGLRDVESVVAVIDERNVASLHVARRVGFRRLNLPRIGRKGERLLLFDLDVRELQMNATQLEYWRRALPSGLPLLELECDFARLAVPPPTTVLTTRAAEPFALPSPVELCALSPEATSGGGGGGGGESLAAMLSAWAVLLCRHAAQEEVVIGVRSDHWPLERVGKVSSVVAGSSLPVLIGAPRGCSLSELSDRLSVATAELCEHTRISAGGAVSLDRIAAATQHAGSAGEQHDCRHPLFQASFEWRAARCDDDHTHNDVASTPVLDLALLVFEGRGPEGARLLEGRIEYNGMLYEGETIGRMARALQSLLKSAISAAHSDVWALEMHSAEEAARLLTTLSNSAGVSVGVSVACIHDLVEAQATRTPLHAALEWCGMRLTYAQLLRGAMGVASSLQAQAVLPDRVVALLLPRSLEQVVGLLGVLLAEGAYVPLDTKWPADRRRLIIADAACDHLLATSATAPLRPSLPPPSLTPSGEAGASIRSRVTPHHLAYVMYTSGSTGKPKGVMVPHVGVVNLLTEAAHCRYAAHPTSVFGVPTPYVFDGAL